MLPVTPVALLLNATSVRFRLSSFENAVAAVMPPMAVVGSDDRAAVAVVVWLRLADFSAILNRSALSERLSVPSLSLLHKLL